MASRTCLSPLVFVGIRFPHTLEGQPLSKSAAEQHQFLDVIDRDEAERRWRAAFEISPNGCGSERLPLTEALGRVLAEDLISQVDVPFFDRSNLDGFAVRAVDTYGAEEERSVRLRLLDEVIATAIVPKSEVRAGEAVAIATGGMMPRGADAIVMVEHTEVENGEVLVFKPVTPGRGLTFAGTDIPQGETVYRRGDVLTSRETGVLAAIGVSTVTVQRRPRVGILSTGDEIIEPSAEMKPGLVFDSNAQVLADAIRELGGEPVRLGIVADDRSRLRELIHQAVEGCDLLLMSGGTSKGAGDICYQVVREFQDPGIVAHGVALKPGKPICLAATKGKPVVILPGFPTSAIFTFHEFVADVILEMAGRPRQKPTTISARMATQVNSEIGRTEYLLVGLVRSFDPDDSRDGPYGTETLAAYPMGKGSGSVTTFARADGFVTIDRHQEIVDEGTAVNVTLLGRDLSVADLVVIGSHCIGLDYLLGELQRCGVRTKFLAVGSTAGLRAVEHGECDVAGVHLLDAKTGVYNKPFVREPLQLVRGYDRRQGIVFRKDDERFLGKSIEQLLDEVVLDGNCVMVNRNQGSGTRILIDELLGDRRPSGYAVQSRSHNAVAASVAQRRSDWGIAIEVVATQLGLGFLPIRDEQYDFVMRPKGNVSQALELFRSLLQRPDVVAQLREFGFRCS